MKALTDVVWTPESLARKSLEGLKQIRVNAAAKGRSDIVELCDNEIARRTPRKELSRSSAEDRPVRGIHLICERRKGVQHNANGSFWTGVWAVAKKHAERAESADTYVALHESQSELSYLQGKIKGWRIKPRQPLNPGDEIRIEEGIEFLLEPTSEAFPWRGNGIVERSYWYGDDEVSQTE